MYKHLAFREAWLFDPKVTNSLSMTLSMEFMLWASNSALKYSLNIKIDVHLEINTHSNSVPNPQHSPRAEKIHCGKNTHSITLWNDILIEATTWIISLINVFRDNK